MVIVPDSSSAASHDCVALASAGVVSAVAAGASVAASGVAAACPASFAAGSDPQAVRPNIMIPVNKAAIVFFITHILLKILFV